MSDLLPFLAKLTLWCALPFALRPLLRRCAAATRHLLLTLALAGTLVLPLLLTATPAWLDLPGQAPSWLARTESTQPKALPSQTSGATPRWTPTDRPSTYSFGTQQSETAPSGTSPVSTGALGKDRPSFRTRLMEQAANVFAGGSALGWFLLAWLLGAAGVSLHTMLLLHKARVLVQEATAIENADALAGLALAARRLGLPTSGKDLALLLESTATPVPFAWRSRRNAIVLPAHWRTWDSERLTVVLVHELAHLHRKDSVALWIGRAATALWWFHPLVHGLDRWARRECERAADDAVLLSGSRASDYANHLLAIGRALAQPLPSGVALMMSKSPDFKQRLTAILRADLPRQTLTRGLAFGATFTALAVAVTLAGAHFGPDADAQEMDKAAHDPDAGHSDHGKDHPKGPEGDYSRAMEAHRAGRYEEAIRGFEASAAAGRRPATATYNAACAYALSGRSGEAMDALRQALDLGLDDLDLLTEDSDLDPLRANPQFQALVDEAFANAGETRDAIEGYRYRTAIERINLLRENNSQDADAWSAAARDVLYMGEPDLAVEAFTNAIRLDSEPSANTIYNLACVYAMDGRKSESLKTLERAIAAGYSDPDHMLEDPDLAALRGDATFDRLVKLAKDLDLDQFRAALWDDEHRKGHSTEYSATAWRPAIDFYRDFVKKNPNLGAGWFNLAYALHYSKQFDESVKIFRKASDLGYRPSISTYNIACGLAKLNRSSEALDVLEEALKMSPKRHFDFKGDDDLDSLRNHPTFLRLVLQYEMLGKKH